MALKIRLQRGGSTHNPVYRVVVAESTSRRDGRFVEIIGSYSPQARGQDMEYQLKMDRVEYWMSVGAKPTDTIRNILRALKRGETGKSKRPSSSVARPKADKAVATA
jgi:small subunit ribosomal protein S16